MKVPYVNPGTDTASVQKVVMNVVGFLKCAPSGSPIDVFLRRNAMALKPADDTLVFRRDERGVMTMRARISRPGLPPIVFSGRMMDGR